jgi:hypothetical protein
MLVIIDLQASAHQGSMNAAHKMILLLFWSSACLPSLCETGICAIYWLIVLKRDAQFIYAAARASKTRTGCHRGYHG